MKIAKMDGAVKDLEKEGTDKIRAKISLTFQHFKSLRENPPKYQRKALKDLLPDAKIVILPADKVRATVILNHKSYLEKMPRLYKQWFI